MQRRYCQVLACIVTIIVTAQYGYGQTGRRLDAKPPAKKTARTRMPAQAKSPAREFMPEFNAFDPGVNKIVSSDSLRGSVVVVYFSNKACRECKRQTEGLKRELEGYGDDGLVFVHVQVETKVSRTAKLKADAGAQSWLTVDSADVDELCETLEVDHTPAIFLYDSEGMLISQQCDLLCHGKITLCRTNIVSKKLKFMRDILSRVYGPGTWVAHVRGHR